MIEIFNVKKKADRRIIKWRLEKARDGICPNSKRWQKRMMATTKNLIHKYNEMLANHVFSTENYIICNTETAKLF